MIIFIDKVAECFFNLYLTDIQLILCINISYLTRYKDLKENGNKIVDFHLPATDDPSVHELLFSDPKEW